jgi:hypothetical protein
VSDHRELAAPRGERLPTLAKLIELMTRRLQSGESVDPQEFVDRYPGRARSIRVLLPTLFDLVELGRSVPRKAAVRRSRGPFPGKANQRSEQ